MKQKNIYETYMKQKNIQEWSALFITKKNKIKQTKNTETLQKSINNRKNRRSMLKYGILYSNKNKWPTATCNIDELHKPHGRKKSNINRIIWFY